MRWIDGAILAATGRLGDFAELATAIIAALALIGAVVQLRQARNTTLETRAHQYLERYGAPRLIPYRVKAHALIGRELDEEIWPALFELWERLSFGERQEVLVIMSFWEELAGMYNRNLVDQEIIYEYFCDVVYDFWRKSAWLRSYARSGIRTMTSTTSLITCAKTSARRTSPGAGAPYPVSRCEL